MIVVVAYKKAEKFLLLDRIDLVFIRRVFYLFYLGIVLFQGADIDTLCVVPKYVQRADFFSIFPQMLQETGKVTELSAVPDAYVPVNIPFKYFFLNVGDKNGV